MRDQKVQVFSLGLPKKGAAPERRRYRVKWAVDGRHKTRSFKTREQADRLRSRLQQAVRAGERFDVDSGEPVRWEQSAATWWSWSSEWLALKWPQWAGTSRRSAAESLTAITPHLARRGAPDPPADLNRWLWHEGFVPSASGQAGRELSWLERWSVPLAEITPAMLETGLTMATTRRDGQRMAASVSRRRYNTVKAVLSAAVRRGLIDGNPIDRMVWSLPRNSESVNIATLPSIADVAEIVDDLAAGKPDFAQYAAFFATIGFAGLRPSEVARLRAADLTLPSSGWGEVQVVGALTSPGARYTADGEVQEEKGLKHRADSETRRVPLPPPLVSRLAWHVDRWSRQDEDRVFLNRRGNDLAPSNWSRPWRQVRAQRWPAGHPLADIVPYDLRHTAATMMLRAGVTPSEVARRLGHSVEMLMRIYAGVFEDEAARANALIEKELQLP